MNASLLLTVFAALTSCAPELKLLSNSSTSESFISYSSSTRSLSDSPSLDECLLHALQANPEVKTAYSAYLAAVQKAPQVAALPEPTLSYSYFINAIETRVDPMRHKVGLTQRIPWFGKLSLKEQLTNLEAQAAMYSFLSEKNQLVAKVVQAFYELAYLGHAQQVTAASLELLKGWEPVLNQRYRAGTSSQADLIKVQVELAKLEDNLRKLAEFSQPLRAELNALLNRPITTPLIVSDVNLQEAFDDATAAPPQNIKDLDHLLKDHNPELLLLKALIDARATGVQLAEKNFYPDFGIGIEYTAIDTRSQMDSAGGNDAFATMFSINLPTNLSSYRAGLREAQLNQAVTENSLTAKYVNLSARLAKQLFKLIDSSRRVKLYSSTLIPKAQEALEPAFLAFEAGQLSFLDLLDRERDLLEFHLNLKRSQVDTIIASSQLNALLGDYVRTS